MGRRSARMLGWLVRTLLAAAACYLAAVLIGLIPVNNDFRPTPDGIEIFIVSNPVHADLILPIETATIDWRDQFPPDCFAGDTSSATHLAIGWGDRAFYLETPTWAELRFSTVVKAIFWPTASCLHVSLTRAGNYGNSARSVRISAAQYERLVHHVLAAFRGAADGSKVRIGRAAYGSHDAFFEARGSYHCFNTCHCWVGQSLRAAGVRTGWFTPLPKTVFLYLPEPRFAAEATAGGASR